jgi:hypothetical protein
LRAHGKKERLALLDRDGLRLIDSEGDETGCDVGHGAGVAATWATIAGGGVIARGSILRYLALHVSVIVPNFAALLVMTKVLR